MPSIWEKTVKGRTPPIEGKKKIKAILATDHFSAFKYPTSNKSMREEGCVCIHPWHIFPNLHKRAEQWKHRPEIPLSNEEVKNYREKDTNSNQETDKKIKPYPKARQTTATGIYRDYQKKMSRIHIKEWHRSLGISLPSFERATWVVAGWNQGGGWMFYLKLPQTTMQGLLSKTKTNMVQYQQPFGFDLQFWYQTICY